MGDATGSRAEPVEESERIEETKPVPSGLVGIASGRIETEQVAEPKSVPLGLFGIASGCIKPEQVKQPEPDIDSPEQVELTQASPTLVDELVHQDSVVPALITDDTASETAPDEAPEPVSDSSKQIEAIQASVSPIPIDELAQEYNIPPECIIDDTPDATETEESEPALIPDDTASETGSSSSEQDYPVISPAGSPTRPQVQCLRRSPIRPPDTVWNRPRQDKPPKTDHSLFKEV